MTDKLISKVLILDECADASLAIKLFCEDNNLIGLKVQKNRLMDILKSNIDLGAILYAEDYGDTPEENADIALRIHAIRPELPIILRRTHTPSLDGVDEAIKRVFCAAYTTENMAGFKRVIDEYIFSLVYPNALVRGISEITESVLASQFKNLILQWDTPYIVRDRVIFGEVFSLIPIESNWCRGYMMLQTEEDAILGILNSDPMFPPSGFRDVNSILGEVTNLIWGGFKNRFIGDASTIATNQIQVPLIVNHKHKYISFGTENPQLCFFYTMTDNSTGRSVKLYQRFVFNLNWSPEDFKEIAQDSSDLMSSGELELF